MAAFSKMVVSLPRRLCNARRPTSRSDFFCPRSAPSRPFTRKPSLFVVARPFFRPQLPFLYPFAHGSHNAIVGRYISTERKQRWKDQFRQWVRINLYLWPGAALILLLSLGMIHVKLERDYPTPREWSFWSRWVMRYGKFVELAENAKINAIKTDWVRAGRLYTSVLERLESEKLDGQNLIREQSTLDHRERMLAPEALNISAKSEQWRRGYHEVLMGAARVAENLGDMCKLKGVEGGRVYPKESILGPNNPRPKPLPYDKTYGKVNAPSFDEIEDAFPSADVFYQKILNTAGFDTRQRLDAALAYADWYDFQGNARVAENLYTHAAEIAQQGLSGRGTDAIDYSTGMILKGQEDAVTDNILRACTAFGVHHARNGNVKKALPVFLSILKARKSLPAAPASYMASTIPPREEQTEGLMSYVVSLQDLFIEREYPDPPPSGNTRPYHTLKEACEEVGLMTYIGEILFATSESERAKGLSWTRDSVEAAEAIMWVMDEQKQLNGRERCRECLATGLDNWKAMAQKMARLATKQEERKRWEEENVQIELRRQKTLPLLQEPLSPISGGWLSTRV